MRKIRFTEEQMVKILRATSAGALRGEARRFAAPGVRLDVRVALDERDRWLIGEMQRLAGQYPRYGYRRIRIFLRRTGHHLSIGRTWRL